MSNNISENTIAVNTVDNVSTGSKGFWKLSAEERKIFLAEEKAKSEAMAPIYAAAKAKKQADDAEAKAKALNDAKAKADA